MRNFGYVLDGRLAGLAHPMADGDPDQTLAELHDEGIRALVSLDEAGVDPESVRAHGLAHLHLPIADFEPPTVEQGRAFVAFVSEHLAAGEPVAAHCAAGIGRTGTMLAAYLISTGMGVQEAIDTVRRRRPYSIESDSQVAFLHEFAAQAD